MPKLIFLLGLIQLVVGLNCPSAKIDVLSLATISLEVPQEFSSFTVNQFYNQSVFNCEGLIHHGGQTAKLPGFYFQDFTPIESKTVEDQRPSAQPMILLRYTPSTVGDYAVEVRVNGVEKGECKFSVVDRRNISNSDGFIGIGENNQHFSLGNKTFFVVGENLAWTDSLGVATFEHYFKNLSQNGANYVRVWLTDSWVDLFLETELGNYSLSNAWHIDRVLQLAESMDIKVLMCIESFNLFCSAPPPMPCNWDSSVYNKANGGPLNNGGDFFSDVQAKALFQQRLRYIVARYGFSKAVFAWEFFNEVDLTDNYNQKLQTEWLQEMTKYITSIDVHSHPVSTSITQDELAIYSLPEMSFSMVHTYSSHNRTDMADNVRYWTGRMSGEYVKPGFIAETGELYPDSDYDPSGVGFHNSLWASVATASAGTAMTWWWDSWIARHDLYSQFAAVSAFVNSPLLNWKNLVWRPLEINVPQCIDASPSEGYSCAQLTGLCSSVKMIGYCCKSCFACSAECVGTAKNMNGWRELAPNVRMLASTGAPVANVTSRNTTAVLWIQNSNNTFTAQNVSLPASQRPVIRPIREFEIQSFSLGNHFEPGCYRIEWFDTYSGAVISDIQMQLGCQGEECSLSIMSIPTFERDIAAIIAKKEIC